MSKKTQHTDCWQLDDDSLISVKMKMITILVLALTMMTMVGLWLDAVMPHTRAGGEMTTDPRICCQVPQIKVQSSHDEEEDDQGGEGLYL